MRTEPTPEQIRDEAIYRTFGLTDEEYARITERLSRLPNYVETGIFSVLWSEHCSYKSSKIHLKKFPTTGPQVLQGPGENAGVVDIGDGIGIAFKMESHNHPSAVEPYQGAATGVGGILRDVFTMGARPIAFLNSLRFGPLTNERTRYLFSNIVAGIGGYGNCVGIPTVGGEVVFDKTYETNPLVNAMCVGMLPAEKIVKGVASGVGNPVFVVGSRTGRDGIHGATFASAEDPLAKERSAVQVGDPFLGKLLMEACLELMETNAVVGIQDMGAAGLTSSAAEMASRASGGIEMYLDKVPVREKDMTPYEMMLSESQERMLCVLERGNEQAAFMIFKKWGLEIAEIGKVTDDGMLRLYFHGELVGNMPVAALVDEAPLYDRPVKAPSIDTLSAGATDIGVNGQRVDVVQQVQQAGRPGQMLTGNLPMSHEEALKKLLAHPSIADKRYVYQQYDTSVRAATVAGPGGDAAIVLVPGTNKGVAMTTDGNGRYVYLNPRIGGAIAVSEAARNIVCAGGKPLAVTNCLNFGNPEKPEIMYQLTEAIAGMSEACKGLDTPVVSGNVSLYNESNGEDIYPTPVIGAVGVVEDIRYATRNIITETGTALMLLGVKDANLDGSLYAHLESGRPVGDAPHFDVKEEARVQNLVYDLIRDEIILAAHDISDGGLLVAVSEMCFDKNIGVIMEVPGVQLFDSVAGAGFLFSEAQGRILVNVSTSNIEWVVAKAKEFGVPSAVLGLVQGEKVIVRNEKTTVLACAVSELAAIYKDSIPGYMTGLKDEDEKMAVAVERK
jgi:phosphoribosylformylglycinamidine synthase subunit PurL